jgi:hypothetical protein
LLVGPHPAAGGLLDRQFHAERDALGLFGPLQHVHAHHVAIRIVQDEADEFERHDRGQAFRQVVEQSAEVAVSSDGFRYSQEGAVPRCRCFGSGLVGLPFHHRVAGVIQPVGIGRVAGSQQLMTTVFYLSTCH